MKNWVLISASLIFFIYKGVGQNCMYGYYVDTSNTEVVNYMPVNSSFLMGEHFILLVEMDYGSLSVYKFENFRDSILITKAFNSVYKKKMVPGTLIDVHLGQAKLYYTSADRVRHDYSMLIIRNKDSFFQVIPMLANIEVILACIKEYDDLLFTQVNQVLQLRDYIDKNN